MQSQRGGTPESMGSKAPLLRPRAITDKPNYQRSADSNQGGGQLSSNGLGITGDKWKPGVVDQSPRDQSPSPRRRPVELPIVQQNGDKEAVTDTSKAPVPERRRPPLPGGQANGSQQSFGLQSSKGSNSLINRGNDVPNSATSSNDNLLQMTREIPGGFYPSPSPSEQLEKEGLIPPPLQTSPKHKRDETKTAEESQLPIDRVSEELSHSEPLEAPQVQPPGAEREGETAEEPKEGAAKELARPGLGRMFGNNKRLATQDLFRKAATAYNAFVPRAGGAGAKMRQQDDQKSGDADGITGVFTPALKRTDTVESAQTSGSIQITPVDGLGGENIPSPSVPNASVPEVKISSPISPAKPQEETSQDETSTADLVPELPKRASGASVQKKKPAEEESTRKRKRRSAQQAQYLSRLGVDMTLFEGRGLEFEDVMNDLSSGIGAFRDKSVDQLEIDLKREIARVEAGSWLEHLGQKDERVEAVEKLLDRAIAEVDEFEGLLTLYSVELSVSTRCLLSQGSTDHLCRA